MLIREQIIKYIPKTIIYAVMLAVEFTMFLAVVKSSTIPIEKIKAVSFTRLIDSLQIEGRQTLNICGISILCITDF